MPTRFGLKPWEKTAASCSHSWHHLALSQTRLPPRRNPPACGRRERLCSGHRASTREADSETRETSRCGAGEGPLRVQLPAESNRTEQSRTWPSRAESGRAQRVRPIIAGSDRVDPSGAE